MSGLGRAERRELVEAALAVAHDAPDGTPHIDRLRAALDRLGLDWTVPPRDAEAEP